MRVALNTATKAVVQYEYSACQELAWDKPALGGGGKLLVGVFVMRVRVRTYLHESIWGIVLPDTSMWRLPGQQYQAGRKAPTGAPSFYLHASYVCRNNGSSVFQVQSTTPRLEAFYYRIRPFAIVSLVNC